MRRKVKVTGVSQTTEYLDGFQYASTNVINGGMVMDFFPTAEGYVKLTEGKRGMVYNYVYNYTDHLGNVRLSYGLNSSGVIEIMEENNYYPFGLKHRNYNMSQKVYEREGEDSVDLVPCSECPRGYQYKYNGKEFQDELGLNLYDYGARNYDPALGRWMNIDPLAEKGRRLSPYVYCYNNPIIFVDPDGMYATPPDWYIDDRTGKVLGQDGAATNNIRIINSSDYNSIKETNGGSTTSTEATAQLQNSDVSMTVKVNDTQIQQELQAVGDQSRKIEQQIYIVLDRANAEVKAIRGAPGVDGETTMSYEKRTSSEGVEYNTVGGNLLLGQAHGHNKTQKRGTENGAGTSTVDKNTAVSSGLTIFAVESYNTNVGGQSNISRVTPDGVQTNNIGKTKGYQGTGEGTFNVGLDVLKRWSGIGGQ